MSPAPKSSFTKAAKDIEDGLGGLFGALGEALSEMAAKLEEGTSGVVERDHVFDSTNGPVRVHAGVRLRAGGMESGKADLRTPRPVNPNRARPQEPAPDIIRPISYDLFQDADIWVLTAELPGISRKDLVLDQRQTDLLIRTTGQRRFEADVALSDPFDLASIKVALRNGILTLNIPRKEPS